MRWDRNYKQPEVINDPVVIPAYGVTDVERAYWNAKQEALEYDRYPTLRSDKHCTSGVIHRALEDYKTAAVELSQAFFWGQVGGLAQTKEACEGAAEAAAGSALEASGYASTASGYAQDALGYASAASSSATAASQHALAASNSKDAAAGSASAAAQSVLDAQQNEQDAEAWAVGERNGVPVPATDPTYHNNSKYYAALGSEIIQDDEVSLYTTWSSSKLNTDLASKASLVSGKVPASELPSYVDDVIEGYYNAIDGKFYEESTFETEITPEAGKIYTDLATNKTYRWGGSVYAQLDAGLVLGESAGTAYEGSKGKANADNISALQTAVAGKADSSSLASVATSGAYGDLSGLPTIPDDLADLNDDSTHRLVTDTEKSTWNGKADSSDISSAISSAFNGVTFTTVSNDIYINW
jgi:hypothetical protein